MLTPLIADALIIYGASDGHGQVLPQWMSASTPIASLATDQAEMTAIDRLRTLVVRAMLPVMSLSAAAFAAIIPWSSSVPDTPGRVELISPEVAAQQISQCGAGAVDIRYDDLLQSYVLTVRDAAEAQLQCIERAAGYHDVELPPELQKRYDEIRAAKYSAAYREQAIAWLSERGLLDKVPKFRAGETDEATLSRELETICGPTAIGALQSPYGPRTINPEWVKKMPLPFRPEDAEAMSCLMATASVSGFELGFIGNEAYPE